MRGVEVSVRAASLDDARRLWEWRNDPVTRQMSLNHDRVAFADHLRWYESSLASPHRVILVAEIEERPVGMCRFDIDEGQPGRAEVSINIAPTERGCGIGGSVLDASLVALRARHPEVTTITATIRDENSASIRLFLRSGFTPVSTAIGVCLFEWTS